MILYDIANTIHRFRMNWGAGGRRIETAEDYSIFVGDLASDVTDELLLSTFASRFSTVRNAKVVTDPLTRMPKGFGFVRFSSKEDAEQALQKMNGVYCSSRPMRVSVATDRNSTRARNDAGYTTLQGVNSGQENENMTVFVGGVDESITEEVLRTSFAPFGEVCEPTTRTEEEYSYVYSRLYQLSYR